MCLDTFCYAHTNIFVSCFISLLTIMSVFRFVMEYHFSNMIGLYFITISTINYYILSRNIASLYINIFIWCHPPGGEKYVLLFRYTVYIICRLLEIEGLDMSFLVNIKMENKASNQW